MFPLLAHYIPHLRRGFMIGIRYAGAMAKPLMVIGLLIFLAGAWLAWGPRIPWLGRLPGDIVIRRESYTIYVPIVTCILISILMSLISKLFR